MDSDATKIKHLKILEIYNTVKEGAGEFAPYLSQAYYINNTIDACKKAGIKKVCRSVVYAALKREKELKKNQPFL